jgi:hypothetical protein
MRPPLAEYLVHFHGNFIIYISESTQIPSTGERGQDKSVLLILSNIKETQSQQFK